MALVKPIINDIVAFDANIGTTITFMASGGDQVTGNEIKVVLNEDSQTETIVYQNTITGYELSHTIPANVLTNGQYYRVSIRTYDILSNTSPWSNAQPFYCYTTPSLSLNINNGQTLDSSNYHFILTYNQLENEKVDYAIIEVYNNNNIIISNSGNLYNSDYPPLSFSHDIFGLNNHSQYYVIGTVVTINGTIVQTNKILFYTDYNTIIDHNTLTATLDNCNGYVNLHSSIISNIRGISNPDPLSYIDDKEADLRNAVADLNIPQYAFWAKWNSMFTIPTNFLFRMWFYPARQPFEIIRITNDDDTSYIKINFRRDSTTDYLSIRTDNGTVKDLSLGTICNGNTKIFLWIKVVEDVWDIRFEILDTDTTIMEWNNTHNNIPYNVTSDTTYIGESYESFTPSADNFVALSSELTSVIIGNGVFDHLNISNDTDIVYSSDIPDPVDSDILNIGFNGNLNNTPNYTKLVLKRKDSTLLNWLNLSEIDITDYNTPYFINFDDSFIPTGVTQEYALVIYIDNVPSEFITAEVTPTWSKYFLSDKDNKFVLNYAVIYSGQVQNIQNGVFLPIGAKYPIVIQNGEGNYTSGSLQFKVLGYQYEIDKRLDRISITKQKEDILKFLTNGKAKCLTDFNGNIYILKVINSPQISYDANWGNGIPTISFDWVEQGKYNNYEDMLELGLFDYIATE